MGKASRTSFTHSSYKILLGYTVLNDNGTILNVISQTTKLQEPSKVTLKFAYFK